MSDIKDAAELGFLHAKRTMVQAIDNRLEILNESLVKLDESDFGNTAQIYREKIYELEALRNYVRNVMLWKVE
jgi:hypothetical protein